MIKFFRKIRQQLLTDNKFTKYLVYAAGEIVLVVIGILIALQLNEWNGNIKKDQLRKEYTAGLISDLTKDTVFFNERLRYNTLQLESRRKAIDSIIGGRIQAIEDINPLYPEHFQRVWLTNVYNTNSFNLLISSGNIDLFDRQMRESIMELNRLQTFEDQISSFNRDYYFDLRVNLMNEYPANNIANPGIYEDKLWSGVSLEEFLIAGLSLAEQEIFTIQRGMDLTENVLLQTEKLLEQLHQMD